MIYYFSESCSFSLSPRTRSMPKAPREAIGKFLQEFKEIATEGGGIHFIHRRKNIESLAYLGLTRRNCKEEILSLSVVDYCGGPKADRGKPGEIWEFGKVIAGMEVYIKLKIAQVGEERIAKCLSFHVAQVPIRFPYKDDLEKKGV